MKSIYGYFIGGPRDGETLAIANPRYEYRFAVKNERDMFVNTHVGSEVKKAHYYRIGQLTGTLYLYHFLKTTD